MKTAQIDTVDEAPLEHLDTGASLWGGEHLDVGVAIDALLCLEGEGTT